MSFPTGKVLGVWFGVGVLWAISEYISVQVALLSLASVVGFLEINTNERFDKVTHALEMYSKKIFPEAWDND